VPKGQDVMHMPTVASKMCEIHGSTLSVMTSLLWSPTPLPDHRLFHWCPLRATKAGRLLCCSELYESEVGATSLCSKNIIELYQLISTVLLDP